MNNRARNLIRAIALLLIAVVTIEFLSAGVLRDQSYSLHLRAKAAEDTESEAGELNIPVNESVDGYDPEKNGYYAYLKLRYQLPQDGYEFEDTYLPVLCYNDCIYVRTDLLIDITGLLCDIRGDEVTFTSQNEAKRLLMNVGKNKYVYGEGYVDSQPFPLRTYSINFDAVPVRIEEFVYVPLNLVLSMFGIPMIISNSGYYIARHEDDALDVLLKLYATADHADGVAGAEYIPNAIYEDGNLLLGSLTDYFYGFLTFNSKALKMAIPSLDTNGEGVRYYGEIATDLMSMEPDLARVLDDGAKVVSPFVFALISILQYNKAVDEIYQKSGLSFETVQKAVKDLKMLKSIEADYNNAGFAFVPEYNYKELYNTWSRWDRSLKNIDLSGIAVDVALDVFDNFLIYAYRDTASAVGMKVLLQDEGDGKKLNTGAYLNKEEYQALIKEFKNFVPDQWADEIAGKEKKVKKEKNETAQTIIMQSADEVALNATQALIGMLSVVPAAVKAGLSTIDLVANALKISLVSSSNSLLKAYYGQTLLEDIGKKLYAMEKTKLGSRGTSNANYRDMIALSYLYLRLTTLEYEYIINTLNATEGIKKTLEGRLEELYSMILVLVKACPRGEGESDWGLEDVVVSTPEMRISDARKSLKNGIPEDAVIPLYMKIRGNVVEKTEKEPPVPDAKCDFSMKDDNSGYFDANEEGTFSVYLPLQDQDNMTSDLKALEKKEFKLNFSSESVDGTAAIKVQFEPKGDKDLGKIYLGDDVLENDVHPELAASSDNWFYVPEKYSSQITKYSKDRNESEDTGILSVGEGSMGMQYYDGKLYVSAGAGFYVYDEASAACNEIDLNTSDIPSGSLGNPRIHEWQIYEDKLYYIYLDQNYKYFLNCADLSGKQIGEPIALNNNPNYWSSSPQIFIQDSYLYYSEFLPAKGQENTGPGIDKNFVSDIEHMSSRIWRVPLDGGEQEIIYTGKEGYSLFFRDITSKYLAITMDKRSGNCQLILIPLNNDSSVMVVADHNSIYSNIADAHFYNNTLLYAVIGEGLYQYDLVNNNTRLLTDQLYRPFAILDDYFFMERHDVSPFEETSVWYSLTSD